MDKIMLLYYTRTQRKKQAAFETVSAQQDAFQFGQAVLY